MNWARIVIASVFIFFIFFCLDFVAEQAVPNRAYFESATLFKPGTEQFRYLWAFELCMFFFCFFFCIFFARGYKGKGILEGVSYGLLIFLFIVPALVFGLFFTLKLSPMLAVCWSIRELVKYVIAGIVVAAIYTTRPRGTQ